MSTPHIGRIVFDKKSGDIKAFDGRKWVKVYYNESYAQKAMLIEQIESFAKSGATLNRNKILKQMLLKAYKGDNFEIVKQCKRFSV